MRKKKPVKYDIQEEVIWVPVVRPARRNQKSYLPVRVTLQPISGRFNPRTMRRPLFVS